MQFNLKVLLLIFCINCGNGAIANKNVTYLYKVYAAEEAIIEGDYNLALQQYQMAFELKKEKIFAQDIYNALICALAINEQQMAKQLLEQLTQTGVGEAFIKNNFEHYFSHNTNYFDSVCLVAEKVKEDFNTKNKILLDSLESLVNEDQHYHILWAEHCRSVKINFETIEEDTVFQTMNEADTRISKLLKALFDRGNTLSEFQLGAFTHDDLSFKTYPDFHIIIMHNYQGFKTADTLFTSILIQQINSGDLKPISFSILSDANSTPVKKEYGNSAGYIIVKDDTLYYNKHIYGLTDWNKELETNRKEIYLYSLQDQLKRCYFNIFSNSLNFSISTASIAGNTTIDKEYFEAYVPEK